MESREILGVKVDFGLSTEDVLAKINDFVVEPGPHNLFTVNPEFIMKARHDSTLRKILNSASLSVPDGAGLIFAKKYLDGVSKMPRNILFPFKSFIYGVKTGLTPLNQPKVTGADMIFDICRNAEEKGQNIFLLGGWEKDPFGRMKTHHGHIADKAAQILKESFPRLKIVGASSEFSTEESDSQTTVNLIREKMTKGGVDHIDILFLASTSGKQEKWINTNLAKIPARVGIGVGATFDFIIGNYKRAPTSMRKNNLEWMFKLITQPWRIRRIFRSFPIFPLLVYFESLKSPEQR